MSFHSIKVSALAGLIEMETKGLVTRANSFQAMIDAIAYDIRSKSAQRVKRRTDLERVSATLVSLDAKSLWLDEKVRLTVSINTKQGH